MCAEDYDIRMESQIIGDPIRSLLFIDKTPCKAIQGYWVGLTVDEAKEWLLRGAKIDVRSRSCKLLDELKTYGV